MVKYNTSTGSEKSGNGGAPSDGKIETIVRMITSTGIKMARHSAIRSCHVNLQTKQYTVNF